MYHLVVGTGGWGGGVRWLIIILNHPFMLYNFFGKKILESDLAHMVSCLFIALLIWSISFFFFLVTIGDPDTFPSETGCAFINCQQNSTEHECCSNNNPEHTGGTDDL